MLDTLIDIGNTLRNSNIGKIRYHRYFKAAPLNDEKKKIKVSYWSIPVDENFDIQFDDKSEIIDQNLIRNNLFYLTYKASETSPENKYIFGDIQYGTDKDGKEIGFYKLGNPEKKGLFGMSSFGRGIEDAKQFNGTLIEKFRTSFENQRDEIEKFLHDQAQNQFVYLHFDFGGKSWYQFEGELKMINDALLNYFIEKQNDVFVLRNFIYKTLIKSVSSLPNFSEKNTFKTKAFRDSDEVLDLIYSLDYSKKALVSERDIKIIILPRGKDLDAQNIIDFFEQNSRSDLTVAANQKIEDEKDEFDEGDSILSPVVKEAAKNFTQFDFIFSKRGEKGKDDDLLEVSGIERSFLDHLNNKIKQVKDSELLQERRKLYPTNNKQFWGFDLRRSFLNILGDVTTDKKKYQSHLLKVLPQIYSGNYYRDDVILPAFIEKVEYNVRNTETGKTADYNLLKYDYYFLVLIRNKNGGDKSEDKIMMMKNDNSYKMGLLLGHMAQRVSYDISSFEKGYVGLLSRHISSFDGLVSIGNFIKGKLSIHNRLYYKVRKRAGDIENVLGVIDENSIPNYAQISLKFDSFLTEMNPKTYNQEYCACGFFEGYFAKYLKSDDKSVQADEEMNEFQEENQ